MSNREKRKEIKAEKRKEKRKPRKKKVNSQYIELKNRLKEEHPELTKKGIEAVISRMSLMSEAEALAKTLNEKKRIKPEYTQKEIKSD